MIFLFNYLKLGVWSTIYYFRPNDVIFDIVINNIKKCGPIIIKLTQWVLPKIENIYDIDKYDKKNAWFNKLEEVYEDCDFHSLDYTKQKYKDTFKNDFEKDYINIEEVASGSIGQVYKITDKKNRDFAMKILHPHVNEQIYFYTFLFWLIKTIPPLHSYLNYYFPIDIHSFIKDFKMQTDLINEANHNIHFTNIYHDNPYIIIPKLYKFSNEIIVMSYEEGERYDTLDLSDYLLYKTITLLKLFNKNNEAIYQFMHGDLHKGNWKVRVNKSEVKLVIYDFGFCWKMPNIITKNLVRINQVFMDLILEEKTNKKNKENIRNFAEIATIFCENKIPLSIMQKEVNHLIENKGMKFSDSTFFIKLILNSTRIKNTTINPYVLSCIIGHTQMDKLYNIIMKDNLIDNKEYNERYIYFKYFGDLISFCETNNIFIDYIEYLKKELEVEKERRNIKADRLFMYNETLDTNETLKNLCIQED